MNQEPVQTDAQTQEEVRKYLRMIPEVAEPNFARVLEIKEQIEQGTYLTREIIEETASRLALRFLRKE
jgi:anti-sigma28 factor (negative regulator of flagellin synthesis)